MLNSRAKIESPCVKVCAVDGKSGLCVGCGRTLREIGGWSQMTDEERLTITSTLSKRLQAYSEGQVED